MTAPVPGTEAMSPRLSQYLFEAGPEAIPELNTGDVGSLFEEQDHRLREEYSRRLGFLSSLSFPVSCTSI